MLSRPLTQFILSLMFFVSSSFALSNAEFTYNVIDGGIEVTGCVDECPRQLVIPEEIDSNPVVRIGNYAFYGKGIEEVVTPNSLITIGRAAFMSNKISSLYIGINVELIDTDSIRNNDLSNVNLPSKVKNIGSMAFSGNNLTSVTIPDSVDRIWGAAFSNNQLTEVTISNGVYIIGNSAFAYNQLTSLIIPESVTSVDEGAFKHNQLTEITFLGDRPYIHEFPFSLESQSNTLAVLFCPGKLDWPGDSIEGISPQLDENCQPPEFSYNVIYDGIEVTGCVDECPSGFFIPEQIDGNTVTSIAEHAFMDEGIFAVEMPETLLRINSFAFFNNNLSSIEIPSSVSFIGGHAFDNNRLTSLQIPNSLTIIHESAFRRNQLTELEIPSNITDIRVNAFSTNKLTSISISDSLTNISANAFYNNQLTSVTIPNSVDVIGDNTFSLNPLTEIIFLGERPDIGVDVFRDYSWSAISSIYYCSGAAGWPGEPIDGITPQFEGNCTFQDEQYATFDIDQSGSVDALSDGLILLRYFFGLREDSLISGVISPNANRTSASDIEAYIESHMP